MFPDRNCKRFFILLDELRPFYDEKKISKKEIETFPFCFKKTVLGFRQGALTQWRGPFGLHIREYDSYFSVHRDILDPGTGLDSAIQHLVFDVAASEIPKYSESLSRIYMKLLNWKIREEEKEHIKRSRLLIWEARLKEL